MSTGPNIVVGQAVSGVSTSVVPLLGDLVVVAIPSIPGSVAIKAKPIGSVSVSSRSASVGIRSKALAGVQAAATSASVRAKSKWSNVSAASETRQA